MKNGSEHTRLGLYRSLFETRPEKAQYQVDIVPSTESQAKKNLITIATPYIADIDGLVFIEHKKIYRTLLAGGEYKNEEGNIEKLSPDFVIRGGQSGYTVDSTIMDVVESGKVNTYNIAP